jgi:deoxyribose-phosphate aldolase
LFVKTSTGFGPIGATIPHVFLLRSTVGENFGVKAAGGIRDFKDAMRMIAAGASRIGSSESVKIMDSYRQAEGQTNWDVEKTSCTLCPSS